ncbi:MAG: hypothetical protein R3B48_21060 [Kofleriaceae bacterium]
MVQRRSPQLFACCSLLASALALGACGDARPAGPDGPAGGDAGPDGPGGDGGGGTDAGPTCPITVAAPKQLMITSLAIVNDPVRTSWTGELADAADGAWHFGRLMTQMAGATDPEAFVRSWIAQWETDVIVNGINVPPRPVISQFINAWPKTPEGKLDLTKAPLRLLAIVNRFDLRGPGDAGEGRFVFGWILDGTPAEFTVIFEYKLLAADEDAVRSWAHAWRDLGAETLGSDAYRAKLQAITDRFTARDAGAGRPNGSAISQVRTNEDALDFPWELREFHVNDAGQLRMVPPALTPSNLVPNFNNSARLATFLTDNAAAIKAEKHTVPLLLAGEPFAAGATLNATEPWFAPGITDSELRHRFSLNTCSGCHGAETSTNFLHIGIRDSSAESSLSGFLVGQNALDPLTGVSRRQNTLADRAKTLTDYLCANR